MNFRVLLLLIGLMVSTASVVSYADDEPDPLNPSVAPPRLYVGPVVGYNKVFQTGNFLSFSDPVRCPTFKDGSGNGYFGGITAEFLIGDPKNSKASIIVRAVYNNMPSSFTEEGDNLPSLVIQDGKQIVIRTTTQHVAEIQYTTADLEIMYKLNLGNSPLVIMAGLAPGFAIKKHIEQRFELISPDNVQFVPGTDPKVTYDPFFRKATVQDGDIPNAAGLRFAIKAGVGYEFILKKIFVVPSVNYNFGLTNMTTTESWKVSALQAQIDIRFAL